MRVSSKQFCFSFRETVFLHWFLFMFQPRSNHLSWQQLYGLIPNLQYTNWLLVINSFSMKMELAVILTTGNNGESFII